MKNGGSESDFLLDGDIQPPHHGQRQEQHEEPADNIRNGGITCKIKLVDTPALQRHFPIAGNRSALKQ